MRNDAPSPDCDSPNDEHAYSALDRAFDRRSRRRGRHNPRTKRIATAALAIAAAAIVTGAVTTSHRHARAMTTLTRTPVVAPAAPPSTIEPMRAQPETKAPPAQPPAPTRTEAARAATTGRAPEARVAPPSGDVVDVSIAALDDLDRCLEASGSGCAGVGRYYEHDRADPIRAAEWYERGCALSSTESCDALARVQNARPAGAQASPP
jgi:hypothetical protein